MPLDPRDPLIPMPWQMDDIRAYRAEKQMKSDLIASEIQKRQLDLQKAINENQLSTAQGRAAIAAENAIALEQMRQKEEGVDISKTPNVPGKSLIDTSKEEGQRLVNQRANQAQRAAIENFLLDKSILPKAKYEAGGVSGEALLSQAPQTQSNVRRQVYQNDYNDFYDMNIHKGESPEIAHQNAIQSASDKQMKAESSGKATVVLPNFGTYTGTPDQLNKMLRDPNTPDTVRKAIADQWGGGQQKASGSDWVRNKLGY
jgi:hypothetical protein